MSELVALRVKEVVGQTAWLCAFATVGGTAVDAVAHIALTAIGDAQGAVDEAFEADFGMAAYVGDLFASEFTGKDDLLTACLLEELDFGDCAVVHLCRCVYLDRGHGALEQGHVLDYEGVGVYVVKLMCQLACLVDFVVEEDGVDGDEYSTAVLVGIVDDTAEVVDCVGGLMACRELWCTDVDCVGAVVDGCLGAEEVAGWCEELYDVAR